MELLEPPLVKLLGNRPNLRIVTELFHFVGQEALCFHEETNVEHNLKIYRSHAREKMTRQNETK